nr:MAG TPA: hypothetical protein [Caudoviricetes sp.]
MNRLLFNPPDETLLSSYFCSSIFLENTGFFLKPVKDNIDHFQSLRR